MRCYKRECEWECRGECDLEYGCSQRIAHQTNAERIRNMTNEELADMIMHIDGQDMCDVFKFCKNLPECDPDGEIPDENCKRCLIEWLGRECDE